MPVARISVSIAEILNEIEERAPRGTAEKWDNVGLLVGDPRWRTKGAVVSIDLTDQALGEAKKRGYGIVVTHHPCIFPKSRGLARVAAAGDGELSSLILEAIRARVAVVSCHTNFDQCALEVVHAVAQGLGVRARGRLIEAHSARALLRKLVVFVPATHADVVREALGRAGAGAIGKYDLCTFSARGEGTFRGGSDAEPFLGEPGRLERVDELRLETVFPRGVEGHVLKAMFEAHPYEEVAYDLYSVEQAPSSEGLNSGVGYGFWGDFAAPRLFSEVAKDVTSLFNIDGFWITSPAPKSVKRIAFAAGKGASFADAARQAGCELLITGEAGYHAALDASRKGMAVMELGHRESELFFVRTMRSWMKELGLTTVEVNPPTQRIWTHSTNRRRQK